MTKSVNDLVKRNKNKQKKIKDFSDILDSLESTEDKKKVLWKEIYENALNDRESANVLFTELLQQSQANAANHAVFGPIMAKYLERMSKSNDQILRLAEMITKSEESQMKINPDDVLIR